MSDDTKRVPDPGDSVRALNVQKHIDERQMKINDLREEIEVLEREQALLHLCPHIQELLTAVNTAFVKLRFVGLHCDSSEVYADCPKHGNHNVSGLIRGFD